MQIKEAIIGQFGKLQNRNISFEPGINVIYGENEAGKTTLHDFLLGMFFGMEKGRGRGTLNSMYQKHEPWHAPSYYSGALRFLVDGKPFYLERNFYYKDKKDILKNEADGEELSVAYGDLAMLLGGIDKETFGNTYDIPQTGAVTGKELADILAEYLSNAAEGGGANIQVQRAKAALAARKRELTQEVKTIHERKNEDIRQLIVEKDLLERDSRGLHANIADAEREIDQLKRVRVEEIGEKRKRLSEQERHQTVRMERQDAAPERTGAEKAGKSEWEKEQPDRMAGIGLCASALLVNTAVHHVTSYPSRLFFILQAVFFAGMILCGLYVGISHVIEKAKSNRFFSQASPILFIDEIHRFSKSQQDSLLGAVETGVVTLIGATTENPSFEVIRPLLSRCQLYVLKSLEKDDLLELLHIAITKDAILKEKNIELKETDAMLRFSGGDARKLLNILELVVEADTDSEAIVITDEKVTERLQQNPLAYDKDGEMHYDIISAFIKSIRGSDPDGALYWLARMVEGGEDPAFIARRLVISAAEDIGLANPNALLLANTAFDAVMKIGWPEGRIPLAEATVYLATSPKSNSAYEGINSALELVRSTGNLPVPLHLRNAPTKLMKQLGMWH